MNGPLKAKPAATVSLTLGNGQVIQLTDPSLDSQPKVQFVAQFDPSTGHIFGSPATQVTQVVTPRPLLDEDVVVPVNHGFQNEFLEDLARSQIVSDSKKVKPKTNAAVRTVNKKKPEPKKKKPSPGKTMAAATAAAAATAVSGESTPAALSIVSVASSLPQIVTTSSGGGTIPRVQTIKLSPQNQQNLRNIQAQIQYLTSKKDPTAQDTSLLQKLIEHHQKILATGKPVPTIPGQHAQGIQFNPGPVESRAEMESHSFGSPISNPKGSSFMTPIPANIQQNTHLANLLRQPVLDKNPRVTSSSSAVQPTTVRYLQPIASVGQQRPAAPVLTNTTNTTTVGVQATAGMIPVRAVPVPSATSTAPSPVVVKVSNGGVRLPAPVTVQMSVASTQSTIPTQTELQSAEAEASNTGARGVKRPASKAMISKSTLFEHQLKTDQNGAVAPDYKTPFKNKSNACKRLIRYHVYHDLDPSPDEMDKDEDEFESKAELLFTKFQQMMNKYQYLLLMESTKEAPASEFVMVERMFVGEEKQSLERLKEEARVAKELQLTPVCPAVVVKSEPVNETLTVNPAAVLQVNGTRESSEDHSSMTTATSTTTTTTMTTASVTTPRMTPKMALLKFTRKDGEGYRSELQEYKEVRIMVEDVIKSNGKIRQALELNNSISVDKLVGAAALARGSFIHSAGGDPVDAESKSYDEWESIQRELATYPELSDIHQHGYEPTVG